MGKLRSSQLLLPVAVAIGVCAMVVSAARSPIGYDPVSTSRDISDIDDIKTEINDYLNKHWKNAEVVPSATADDLQVLRRLSLSLHGTVPSLEEIRRFETDSSPDRLDRWVTRLLSDQRFGDYFSERLARVYVGNEEGQFVLFRRDQFTRWLSTELMANRPYNKVVTEILTREGLWTGAPATNFATAAIANDELDKNKLTARTVRAFLGQRIDCAQCHDDFFGDWKQTDFEGLAAFYGQTTFSIFGIGDQEMVDGKPLEYRIFEPGAEPDADEEQAEKPQGRVVPPSVPFHAEWLPDEGTRRQQLATWVTHPENRRFDRATVNRIWGLVFGRPWFDPVDGLPDPPGDELKFDVLDILGRDFREHDYDLHRLIRSIAASKAFRQASQSESADRDQYNAAEEAWAVFPLIRLRPDQVIGSMLQSKFIKTIDRNSHPFVRIQRFFGEVNFIQEYGDASDEELTEAASTIQQALLRMNGEITQEISNGSLFSSVPRLVGLSKDNRQLIENCFLICLTRRPNPQELGHFVDQLEAPDAERMTVVQDLFWSLLNAPEFSWNH
jgi:hypothetical protein